MVIVMAIVYPLFKDNLSYVLNLLLANYYSGVCFTLWSVLETVGDD